MEQRREKLLHIAMFTFRTYKEKKKKKPSSRKVLDAGNKMREKGLQKHTGIQKKVKKS